MPQNCLQIFFVTVTLSLIWNSLDLPVGKSENFACCYQVFCFRISPFPNEILFWNCFSPTIQSSWTHQLVNLNYMSLSKVLPQDFTPPPPLFFPWICFWICVLSSSKLLDLHASESELHIIIESFQVQGNRLCYGLFTFRAVKQLKQSSAQQLEIETKKMEERIRALKEQMMREKEERE